MLKNFVLENGVYIYIWEVNVDLVSGVDKLNINYFDKILVILNKKLVDLFLNKYVEVLSIY